MVKYATWRALRALSQWQFLLSYQAYGPFAKGPMASFLLRSNFFQRALRPLIIRAYGPYSQGLQALLLKCRYLWLRALRALFTKGRRPLGAIFLLNALFLPRALTGPFTPWAKGPWGPFNTQYQLIILGLWPNIQQCLLGLRPNYLLINMGREAHIQHCIYQ